MSGGVANRTWLGGNPYPLAGLTLRVRAAEERGARLERLLEEVEEVDELEVCFSEGSASSRRLDSLVEVGSVERSGDVSVGGDEKGWRFRIGVRIARVRMARSVMIRRVK